MQFSVRLLCIHLFLAAVIVLLAGCGSSHSAVSHLYVGNNATPGQVLQFALPLTDHSGATAVVANSATNNIVALALDPSGNLATGDSAGHLAIYNPPFGNSSNPSTSFNNGSAGNSGQLLFNSAGDLYAATVGGHLNIFSHPLSSTSTPSQIISSPLLFFTTGVAIDGAGNLIIGNTFTSNDSNLAVAPPVAGVTPSVTFVTPNVAGARYRHLAISGNQVFVAGTTATTGRVDVYSLPLSSTSTPAFSMTNVNSPTTVAFDGSGNLYVGNAGDHTIRVFQPPFSASSTPSVTLTLNSTFDIESLAIGK